MKSIMLVFLLPLALYAQNFEFELQPDAFAVEINDWRPYAPWAGGMDYSTPELVDLDHDGDLDLFIGDYCGYVKYFKNIGTLNQPNFQFITDFFDSLHGSIVGYQSNVDFVDLNGDSLLDAVVGGRLDWWSRVLIYFNTGTATQPDFQAIPDTLRDDSGNDIHGLSKTLIDIDRDGDYDLFAGEYDGTIRFYENIGTPTNYQFHLTSSNWFNINVVDGYTKPCFGDLDRDADYDMLLGLGDGTIDYYRNDGTQQVPQMTFMSSYYFGINVGESASPELADIDGDGDLDLFVGKSTDWDSSTDQGDIFFYENIGNSMIPNFQLRTTNYLTFDIGMVANPRLVDIDADGDPDLFTDIGSRLALFRNQGSISFPRFVFETDTFANIIMPWGCVPWFCDLDSDGDYDLLIGTGAIPGPPGLYYYRNEGTPQNFNFVYITDDLVPGVFTQNSVGLSPCTADIDADGDLDLFVRDISYCYFFRNIGTPTHFQFQYETNNWQDLYDGGGPQSMCFYDIDGDRDLDLFVNHETSYQYPWDKNLRFYRNIGTPQDANMQLEINDVFPELMIWSSCPYLIDMDRDGDGDLFVGDMWGGIRYFRNVTGDTTAVPLPGTAPARHCKTTLSVGPNPSNPITAISYELRAASFVNLAVYDIAGRKVATLVSGKLSAGEHNITWDATGNASGVYLIQLLTPQEAVVRKVVVVK